MINAKYWTCVGAAWVALVAGAAAGQTKPNAAPNAAGTTRPAAGAVPSTGPATTRPAVELKPEELEQVVAPVALYPDSLLAQVLMASTYPLEVVQAERWVKQNPKLKDSADALNKQPWDPAVKSLAGFP